MDKTPAQFLRPLLTNEHWDKMEEYLAEEKNRLVTQICKCQQEDLYKLQGQITVINNLLSLKQSLFTEEGRR